MSAASRRALIAAAVTVPLAAVAGRRLRGSQRALADAPEVEILNPGETVKVSTTGPASSVQKAEILVERDLLDRIWTPDSLELIARGYWVFLRRVTLGVIRVHYAYDSRTVTALGAIPLLRFGTPIYEADDGRGRVTWPIDSGILVASSGRGRGHLRVSVERCDRDGVDDEADATRDRVRLIAEVEVANFYPGLRGSGWFARFGAWFYAQTQLRIHVIVCNAYLRSLPRMDFPGVDRTSMPSQRPAGLEAAR
jgi:hypothetical protein